METAIRTGDLVTITACSTPGWEHEVGMPGAVTHVHLDGDATVLLVDGSTTQVPSDDLELLATAYTDRQLVDRLDMTTQWVVTVRVYEDNSTRTMEFDSRKQVMSWLKHHVDNPEIDRIEITTHTTDQLLRGHHRRNRNH